MQNIQNHKNDIKISYIRVLFAESVCEIFFRIPYSISAFYPYPSYTAILYGGTLSCYVKRTHMVKTNKSEQ